MCYCASCFQLAYCLQNVFWDQKIIVGTPCMPRLKPLAVNEHIETHKSGISAYCTLFEDTDCRFCGLKASCIAHLCQLINNKYALSYLLCLVEQRSTGYLNVIPIFYHTNIQNDENKTNPRYLKSLRNVFDY